jgi:hypothetical protein
VPANVYVSVPGQQRKPLVVALFGCPNRSTRCLSHFTRVLGASDLRHDRRRLALAVLVAVGRLTEEQRMVCLALVEPVLGEAVKKGGLAVSEDERNRILACQDRTVIDAWLDRAVTATTTAEIFS